MKTVIIILIFISMFCLTYSVNAQITGTFTTSLAGQVVTCTPTLSAHVDYYMWSAENADNSLIEFTTVWISTDDIVEPQRFVLYAESYIITLSFRSATESGSISARVNVRIEDEDTEIVTLQVTEAQPKFYDGFPDWLKDWFIDRNQFEILIIAIGIIAMVIFFDRRHRKVITEKFLDSGLNVVKTFHKR